MTLHWFCAYTRARCEREVAKRIRQEAQQVAYLPLELHKRKVRGERVVLGLPLIARHVFFATDQPDASTFEAVRAVRGVRGILSIMTDGAPSRIRSEDIETIRAVADELQARFERRWNKLVKQERRKHDTEAVVERLKEAHPQERADVLYELMGRGKKARLRLGDLQFLVNEGLQPAA